MKNELTIEEWIEQADGLEVDKEVNEDEFKTRRGEE